MVDLDTIHEPSDEEIKKRIQTMIKARLKADLARKQRERAMQGYVEIKASDFN